MTFLSLIAVIFLLIGLGLLGYLLLILLQALGDAFPKISIRQFLYKRKLVSLEKWRSEIDILLKERSIEGAGKKILQAVLYYPEPPLLPEHISEHNFKIFAQAITLLEISNTRFRNLEIIEHGLEEQRSLLKLLADAHHAKNRAMRHSSNNWAKKEFDQKIDQIAGELKKNGGIISQEFNALIDATLSKKPGSVKYH